jgi:hypothetical protein
MFNIGLHLFFCCCCCCCLVLFPGTGNAALLSAETSSIVLLTNDLREVITSFHLSKHIYNRIRINFVFVFLYNVIGIPFAAGVFYSAGHMILSPSFASLAMILSILSVIVSSLLLKVYSKPTLKATPNPNLASPIPNNAFTYRKLLHTPNITV